MQYPTSGRIVIWYVRFSLLTWQLHSAFGVQGAVEEYSLHGEMLNCCTMEQFPSLYRNDARLPYRLDGVAINYLESLQMAANFTCKEIVVMPAEIGFSSFLRQMRECQTEYNASNPLCRCDLGTGAWMLRKERLPLVDYLPPFLRDDLHAVVHINNTFSTSKVFFLTVFTVPLWLCMIGLIAAFSFVKLIDRRFEYPSPSFTPLQPPHCRYHRWKHFLLKSEMLYRLRKASQSTLTGILGKSNGPSNDKARGKKTTRQWMLNFVILLCSIFFMLTYEAMMTTKLVQEEVRSSFTNIDSFKSCKIKPEDICVPRGGAVESFWNATIASSKCYKDKQINFSATYDKAVSDLYAKKCKFLFSDGITASHAIYREKCGFYMKTGDAVFSAGQAFVLPKDSNRTAALSKATLYLLAQAQIETLDEYFQRRGICRERTGLVGISLRKLRFFFLAAYFICFLLFLEMVFDPQKERKRENAPEMVDAYEEKEGEGE